MAGYDYSDRVFYGWLLLGVAISVASFALPTWPGLAGAVIGVACEVVALSFPFRALVRAERRRGDG